MNYLLDLLLIIISTWITFKVYTQIIFKRYCSVAYYVILVQYIFCCLPIALNYLIGVPTYFALYWYRTFSTSINDSSIAIIYDIYMFVAIIALYVYGRKANRKIQYKYRVESATIEKKIENKYVYLAIIFLPLLYVIITGNFTKLFTYTSMSARGIAGNESLVLNSLILLSIYCLCIYVFSGEITRRKIIFLVVVSVLLAWLQGKRFIIAVMAILYLFFLSKSNISDKVRKRLIKFFPISGIALVVFAAVYFVVIKPLSNMGFQTIYDMLRVDFGRDDVIKYVIQHEFFLHDHILDYPGQSFFSTLFVFVPRFLWPSKPFSHYQYLSSSILGVSIQKLPSGTTPCWYEMCLCNFNYFGFVFGIFGILFFCKLADNMKQVKSKSLMFMFILVLLTQNTDVYIVYIFLIFVYWFFENTKHRKIVLFKHRKTHL